MIWHVVLNLTTVYRRFPTDIDCLVHIERTVWGLSPVCPYCTSTRTTSNRTRHHCNACNASYRVTVNTVFHGTHLPLQKWFLGLALALSAPRRISARKLGAALSLNRDTAWRLATRIYRALEDPQQRRMLTDVTRLLLVSQEE
jgi:transposase-like protein